ncbi:hypothetical protein I551_7522, partial [Mycobacterium ulcerans str. Harvey]
HDAGLDAPHHTSPAHTQPQIGTRDCRGKGVSGLIGPVCRGRKGRMMTKTVVAVQPSQTTKMSRRRGGY